jgi:hypothetical protein
MPPASPITPADAVEALVVQKALALVRELKKSCQAAPPGQVLAQAEQLALDQGRELIRAALEAVVGQQAAAAEKKGRPAEPVRARDTAPTKAPPSARS